MIARAMRFFSGKLAAQMGVCLFAASSIVCVVGCEKEPEGNTPVPTTSAPEPQTVPGGATSEPVNIGGNK
jgi:hypothetical protein